MFLKINGMKLLVVSVIVCSAICGAANCESAKNENDAKSKSVSSVKAKRGILHYGYGGGNALTYTIPFAHKHYAPSSYSNIPGLYKNVLTPTTTYALSHGGATVQSYNVNFPKYNYIQTKPIVHFHPARPAVIPPVPIYPLAVVPAAKPIIPVSYPVYANRVPFIVQKPVYVQRPLIPAPAAIPFTPAIPIKPTISQVPHYHTIFTPNYSPLPSVPVQSVHPQLIPANPIGTPTIFNIQPDGWRPIVGYPKVPFTPTATAAVNPPAVSLLPPISAGTPLGPSPSEVQPSFASPKSPNNFYLTPTEGASLEQVNQIASQHQIQQSISNEELAHTKGNHLACHCNWMYKVFITPEIVFRAIPAATTITAAP